MSDRFFISLNENTNEDTHLMDAITDPDALIKADPEYYTPKFEAIAELRSMDDGSLHRGNEFRRVASLVNVPIMAALKIIDPNFLLDKKRFYAWLDRGNNGAYCTYDRRKSARPIPNAITISEGKVV